MTADVCHPVDPYADLIGPREVGGVYHCGYWGRDYEVVDVDRLLDGGWPGWRVHVRDLSGPLAGQVRWHCTAWDPVRDRVVQAPARPA